MNSARFAYYPGCSGEGSSPEYEKSTRALCAALGIELVEIPDWTCCGSTPAHTVDHHLAAALAARNFAQAEKAGLEDVLTPCPSCLKNLRVALDHMEDPAFKAGVDALTERPLKARHSVRSVLQAVYELCPPEELAAKITRPLQGLKVVPYYGCLMTRPAKIMRFDNEENPVSMDRLLAAAGAEVLPFPLKTDCCGASFGIPRSDVVSRLSGRILDLAAELGAQAIVAACPLCQMNLDLRQGQINAANKTKHKIPVFYYSQLLALALGVDEYKLGFDKLTVSPRSLLAHIIQPPADNLYKARQEAGQSPEQAQEQVQGQAQKQAPEHAPDQAPGQAVNPEPAPKPTPSLMPEPAPGLTNTGNPGQKPASGGEQCA